MRISLSAQSVLLFQGDSITDCGRRTPEGRPLGRGYAYMVCARLLARFPQYGLTCINRGVSGDRVKDLVARWHHDALDIAPHVISILVGINDTWRAFDSGDPTTGDAFYREYTRILTRITDHCAPQLVLCEPFVLPWPEDRRHWRTDLDEKIHAVRQLSREFGALLVPFDGVMAAACTRAPARYWAEDGVHPTAAGHALLADTWMDYAIGV